jgi:hypothetical protein
MPHADVVHTGEVGMVHTVGSHQVRYHADAWGHPVALPVS